MDNTDHVPLANAMLTANLKPVFCKLGYLRNLDRVCSSGNTIKMAVKTLQKRGFSGLSILDYLSNH